MKKRKAPIIPIILVLGLFSAIVYAKSQQPNVGTFEELQAIQEKKIKEEADAKMEKEMNTARGQSRSAPSAEEIAAASARPENMTDAKRKKVAKATSPMIWNNRQRATRDVVNTSAPQGQWYKDEAGIKPK